MSTSTHRSTMPDVRSRRGAPCSDVACTATALRDLDQELFAEAEVAVYDTECAQGVKVYQS